MTQTFVKTNQGKPAFVRVMLRRYGVFKILLALTIIITLLSVLISAILMIMIDGVVHLSDTVIPILVPAIIVPLAAYHNLSTLLQLDLAEEQLYVNSITDDLTGTYNRRHFIALANWELARAQRYDEIFSIAILDFDNFKDINDTYGHLMGDQALAQVAKICHENIRLPDMFARYGGDEFIFLFSKISKEKACICLERILGEISKNPIQHNSCEIKIQFSVGVADYSSKEFLIDDMFREADMALYQAKCAGKNKIVLSAKTG